LIFFFRNFSGGDLAVTSGSLGLKISHENPTQVTSASQRVTLSDANALTVEKSIKNRKPEKPYPELALVAGSNRRK
jgi:hypothetical protein